MLLHVHYSKRYYAVFVVKRNQTNTMKFKMNQCLFQLCHVSPVQIVGGSPPRNLNPPLAANHKKRLHTSDT